KYLLEGLGVFFLVIILATTPNSDARIFTAPLAAGLALAGLMTVFGPVSGGHFNPVLTLALLISGRISRMEVPYYVAAHAFGAVFGSFFSVFLLGCIGQDEITPHLNDGVGSIVAETLGAFLFTLGFLRRPANPAAGAFACGAMLAALVYPFNAVSLALFNPALAIGMGMSGWIAWADFWIYGIGPLLGAASAASLQLYLSAGELAENA
ncbi:MAG: aquaporin, partial [Saprospiraceae bacterium]